MQFCLIHGHPTHIIIRAGQRRYECCWREHLEREGHVECPKCHKEIFIDTPTCPKCGTTLPYRAGQYWSYMPLNPAEKG